ncbi:MAG: DNA methyltransferase [Candidatus Micrarchaeia archaeon]|jgi:DNA modification methylase
MDIRNDFSIGKYFTFDPSKDKPVYNWFYYKEAFSPEVVDYVINRYIPNPNSVYDPFCGAGTTMLRAKELGMNGFSVDSSPLAVFVSRVKCANYSNEDILEIERAIAEMSEKTENKNTERNQKIDWQFELFPPERAFPPSNLNALLSIRNALESVENEKAANFLMVALLSIMPQTSLIIKDGGVLKVDKKKRTMPTKEAFRKKVKAMLADAKSMARNGNSIPAIERTVPDIRLGDSRATDFESESADLIVTSPPYLNNIDYSKVYGLELSLLGLDKRITLETRNRSVRSFITSSAYDKGELPTEVQEFADKIPIVGSYFSDMNLVLKEMHRILKPNGVAGFVVGNSVIHETHILVDEIIGEMAEKLGFECEIVVGLERIADVRPAKVKSRESMIVMKKQ